MKEMTPERWARVRALLEQAMALPPGERAAALARAEPDTTLVADAQRLLAFEDQSSTLFALEAWQNRAQRPAAETSLTGTLIGSYRLLEEIGRGGMGTVYRAERADQQYQQQVAVKILQENIFSDALVRRFRQERQILAQLQHPGIARLLDGGVLADGRPYLVLEYVDGKPVDRFCEENGLGVEARLRLFLRVAEVVQSAHQQLVLHLDLKPANILVTALGEPRLLDFGIARILQDEVDPQSEATLRLLTPRYASPEQIAGAPLGVASDVFSLATLLYRLLTGKLPYPIEDATPLEAARMLQTQAPTPPSQIDPAHRAELAGDLDTILLQALRKEPNRRYSTVAAFAEDVQRRLDLRPVLAHKDSARYRTGKFLRRNRLPVAVAAVALLVSVASVVAVLRSAAQARRDRAAAERRLHDIEDLARFYVDDLFPALNDIPGTLSVRKMMTFNAVKYLQAMAGERDGNPDFSLNLGTGLYTMALVQGFPNQPNLGDLHGAQDLLNLARQMVELHARQVPGDPENHARAGLLLASQANITNALGDVAGAVGYEQKAWDEVQPVLQGPKSRRWQQISTYCFFDAIYLARDDQFNMAEPEKALLWINRAEVLLLELGKEKPEYLTKPLYVTQLAQVRFTKADLLGKLHQDLEARAYFMQALHDVDGQNSENTVEIAKHLREAHLLYANFLLTRGELATAAKVSEVLRPPDTPKLGAGGAAEKGTFDLVEYGIQTAWWAILASYQGRTALATENMRRSLAVTRTLHVQAPEDKLLTGQHVINLIRFAELPGRDPEEVQGLLSEAVPLAAAFSREHPAVLSSQVLEARAHMGLARLDKAKHDVPGQRQEAAHSLALLESVLQQRPRLEEPAALAREARELME